LFNLTKENINQIKIKKAKVTILSTYTNTTTTTSSAVTSSLSKKAALLDKDHKKTEKYSNDFLIKQLNKFMFIIFFSFFIFLNLVIMYVIPYQIRKPLDIDE